MSKWCDTCYRNEITEECKSCSSDCPVFGKSFDELAKIVIKNEIEKELIGLQDYGTFVQILSRGVENESN